MSGEKNLAESLREAGHDDIADALERKQLGDRLCEAGREDLADALDAPADKPKPADEPNANQREAAAIVGALRDAGVWPQDEAA